MPPGAEKFLDFFVANREDNKTFFWPVRTYVRRYFRFSSEFRYVAFLVGLLLSLTGCSTSKDTPSAKLSSPELRNSPDVSAHSPSAIEAIGRGVAAVTPPGAALKDVYYQFDSVSLESDAREILMKNAEWMKANPRARVEVEGHCDEIGSAEYNLALGAQRAQVAKDFLVTQGIDANRLVTISYGKEAPACFEHNEECRVKNRRARFVMFTEVPTS